jgi:hypothetical protein
LKRRITPSPKGQDLFFWWLLKSFTVCCSNLALTVSMFQDVHQQHTQWVPVDSGQHFAGRRGYFITPSLWLSQAVWTTTLITDW